MTAEQENSQPTPTPTAKPTRLAPLVTRDAKSFWAAADGARFVGQQCGDCGAFAFPPRPMCPHCHSLKRQDVELSGRGKVVSYTIPRHPHPFGFTASPVVAVVELEEGTRLVSNVVGIEPDAVKMDMAVEVCFEPTMNDHKVPVFRPAGRGHA